MKEAAAKMDFEQAASLRDRIKQLRQKLVGRAEGVVLRGGSAAGALEHGFDRFGHDQ